MMNMMIKKYKNFIKESLSFEKETNDKNVDIMAYIDGKYIGKVVIEYVVSGYWEFEDEISEERYDELFPDDRFAKIQYISIATEYTGKGYAKQLMNKALEDIKSNGEKTVYLNASPMGHNEMYIDGIVNFYGKFGFETFIDDYEENKEMILTLESSSAGPNQTLKTIDSYLKMYDDEVKSKEDRQEEERAKKRDFVEPDVIVDDFDEETPELTDKSSILEPTRKHNSLGQGATNMP